MQYLITFLEGIVSFLSPCMLPLLPAYLFYFSGGQNRRSHTLANAVMFVLGFTLVFSVMGIFVGTLGSLLNDHRIVVNLFCGGMMILMGMRCLGFFEFSFLKGYAGAVKITGLFSAFLFGLIYAFSLTPCIGTFLGSALMLASVSASAGKGLLLLILYSLGLGLPFLISAILIQQLTQAFAIIQKHYALLNQISGIALILMGLLTMTGIFV